MATLAKLTSQSTQTLSLLLERQRLQSLSSTPNNSLHLPQITRNLKQLRSGILALEEKEGASEAVRLLKSQYERMRGMLGAEGSGVESLPIPPPEQPASSASSSSSSLPPSKTPSPPPFSAWRTGTPPTKDARDTSPEGPFAPYTDDPEAGPPLSQAEMLQQQREMMDSQDVHLDSLSHSINRQHGLSLQINEELDVHTGLLEGLDEEVDRTQSRLGGARRRLDRVAKGAKENGSTVMIGLLILVLLILIIIFKT
ncbi:hypothetical protein EIP91_012189 [Steccherinum ochraceum]|uniref:t-SNARE coiled-coil homology domain-containing protein n=1 Tax=Steccherinum ochraceum TaxID=92696 RepID=A0A4R0RXC2_9APHY|nr:hypothetical protein EIP91_012189 [Steccherinum ochraceum]